MGLTRKSAQSISKRMCFETTERPDSVLRLLREHGFTNSQISKIVEGRPQVLLAQPEKTLLPKFEFLRSIGVSRSGLSIIFNRNPVLLSRSIERYLIPLHEILKSVLVSDEKVVKALKRMGRILCLYCFPKNLSLLRGLGVSQSSISYLVAQSPSLMFQKVGKFAERVNKKMEFYRRLGLSEDEIRSIFRKHPNCMCLSEKKVMATMDFLVCKMGWQPAAVVRIPNVLCYSLERRIKPRCSVVRVLLLKGLIKADVYLSSVLRPSEKLFLERL
ncbi:hypothetical protein GH714_006010 [Hevea brasiliensis]|uniref:Uncharacterized protein n=1 Tax=Hevea brasiliensis TaxID=3981 RepID=A0A6A6NBR5_HEVBR|nr:hypothetical protein GH714_006010 [Hevea brasiliensis]